MMKCTDQTRASLADPSISDADFANLATHFEDCSACRELAESQFQEDWEQSSFEKPLKDAREKDLEYPVYDSNVDWDSVTQAAIGKDSVPSNAADLLGAATHPELLGRIGRYDVEGVLGAGGTGVVFRAFDNDLHRVVAIKVLNRSLATNAAARKRFAREAQAAAAVLHPNVLPIHNVEPEAETPFLVMQYVPGQSLQARIERDGILEVEDVLRIAKQTAEALAAAHQQGLIHRDVKPANILLESETDRAVLGDFGLARTADDASLTRTGIVAGTPHYMSPEQANGESIGPASDLFSLGGVVYSMLAGRPPFRADTAMGVLHCVCTKKHDKLTNLNNKVPRELSDLVCKLLAKKPQDRFNNATEVAKQLETLLARYQQGKLRLPATQSTGPRNWKRTLGFVGLAVLVLCCSVAWFNRDAIRTLAGYPVGFSSSRQQEIRGFMNELSGPLVSNSRELAKSNRYATSSAGNQYARRTAGSNVKANGDFEAASPAQSFPGSSLPYPTRIANSGTGKYLSDPWPTDKKEVGTGSEKLLQLGGVEQSGNPWQAWDQELADLSQVVELMEQPRSYASTLAATEAGKALDGWSKESQELLQMLEALNAESESSLPLPVEILPGN